MRAPGRKTSQDELKSWPNKKLVQQVMAQIRTDFGGENPTATIGPKLDAIISISDSTARYKVMEMIHELMKDVAYGSRKRVKNKLVELDRRLAVYERIAAKARKIVSDTPPPFKSTKRPVVSVR